MLADTFYDDEPRFPGFRDPQGRFVPFDVADEVFQRAREMRARVLLRLVLTDSGELQGLLYTNSRGLSCG